MTQADRFVSVRPVTVCLLVTIVRELFYGTV